jgi:hypothetical protein
MAEAERPPSATDRPAEKRAELLLALPTFYATRFGAAKIASGATQLRGRTKLNALFDAHALTCYEIVKKSSIHIMT